MSDTKTKQSQVTENGGRQLPRRRRAFCRARRLRRVALTALAVLAAVAVLGILAVRRLPGGPRPDTRAYPMVYEDLIRASAEENGLDPALVAAVILAESDYQPRAVSDAGALGLMQLMPATAEWIAGKFSETCTEERLFEPDTNIRYGCWYLGWLVGRFGGNLPCAVAAYHAGQGTVDAWLKDPQISPDGRTLQTIPSQVTETYVKRVLKYYERYQEKYPLQA